MDAKGARAIAIPTGIAAVVLYGAIGVFVGYPCFRTGLRYGVWLEQCPATDLRLSADVYSSGMLRGDKGHVQVVPSMMWLEGTGVSAMPRSANMKRGFSVDLELRTADGKKVDGFETIGWSRGSNGNETDVAVPPVPDGDYVLHATIDAGFEKADVDLALPLYAPALIHVVTDRPLYKPGQDVLLRAVVLARTDLAPIDDRPGRWRITSPSGEEMLVEKDEAGAFGVADTSFPLAPDADNGVWTATYESGTASDHVSFRVEPFRLPRFNVELEPSDPWYGIGQDVHLVGYARYTSGAPIADAPVAFQVAQGDGRWPMPLEWAEQKDARTDKNGRFTLDLGDVPADLVETATVNVRATVTEAAGESGAGQAAISLSHDALKVDAVTELGDGLVEGFNNRMYVRVTTPDGRPIRNTDLQLDNPWVPDNPAYQSKTDEDGVAAVQLDPGPPVTVVDPAAPIRVRPVERSQAQLTGAQELGRSAAIDLGERRVFDRAADRLGTCADTVQGAASVAVGMRVSSSGRVSAVYADPGEFVVGGDQLSSCVAGALRGLTFPSGPERTYQLTWSIPASSLPWFQVESHGASGDEGVSTAIQEAALGARGCVGAHPATEGQALQAHWAVEKGSTRPSIAFESDGLLAASAEACVERAVAGTTLTEKAEASAVGVATFYLQVPSRPGETAPAATTRTGYELRVTASAEGREIGHTRLVLPPGDVPPLRIRATPSLAAPGEVVDVELIRGPGFSGTLADEIHLWNGTKDLGKTKLDPKTRKASFTLGADVDGFLRIEELGARAVIFVRRPDPLSVAVATDRAAYRPGEQAKLTVTTLAGQQPVSAGVGLIGVDQTLSQLAPLLAPDDWGRVTVRATSDRPAFGSFDPRALALGQIQGENAARAAVVRISQLPMDAAGDDRVAANGSFAPDTTTAQIDGFWRAYEVAVASEREWERSAPAGETLEPKQVAGWWNAALATLSKDGKPAVDGYGRELVLRNLPSDLLDQLDPRALASDGTRLSEDVTDWKTFVATGVI
jgi:hypothetical protein